MSEPSEIDLKQDAADPLQTAKDLFAGAAGGVAQVLIGQPFDIVKVRLQTSTQYRSALECATRIYSSEGALAFYKGTLTPLIGIGACVSVQFGAFHAARRHFEASNRRLLPSSAAGAPLSFSQYYAAGAFAGVTNSVLSAPIEHVRIRLQTQPHAAQRLYAGPLDCIRTLVARAGVAHGLYRGYAVTVLREAQAYGSWFLTYEVLMQADVARRGLSGRDQVETYRLALYGGLAGEMLWLASYPFDVVKSKMQTDGLDRVRGVKEGVKEGAKEMLGEGAAQKVEGVAQSVQKQFGTQRYASMRDCFAQVYRQDGLGGFWKGIGPTLLRAMPVSAATFVVAEMTLRAIS